MKRIVSLLLAVIMIAASLFSLSSCGTPKNAGPEIAVYLGDAVYDFDPTDYYADSNAEQVMSLLFEPLFKVNSKGEIGCAAAKGYTVNEAEREIVVSLRESYWSDEIRVLADDFIYAWREVLLNPENPNPAAALLYDIENAIAIKSGEKSYSEFGAVKTGIYEITIKYRDGADYKQLIKNLASVATSPLRKEVVEASEFSDTYWTKDISTIVSNGPFKISTLDYSVGEFSLARNIGYHQKSSVKDYTDKVTPAELISTFVVGGKAFELTYDDIASKTVFFMGDATLEDRELNASKAKYSDDLSTYTYVFNTVDNPLLAKKEIRQALSLALDRAAIAEAVTFGKAANGFLPNPVAKSVYGKKISARLTEDYEANLAKAKELVASVDFTGISKSFTLTVNNDEASIKIATIAQAAWLDLGFNVTIKPVGYVESSVMDTVYNEYKTIYDSEIQTLVKEASYGIRNFDVLAIDWQMYSTDAFVALSAFASSMCANGVDQANNVVRPNISGWYNTLYDQQINAAYLADSNADRREALKKAEQILLDSCPIVPVLYNQNFGFVSKDLSGVRFDGFGNFVFTKVSQKNYEKYLKEEE
ncbi:MAG: hypothetical protein J6V09_05805 [Clostridia bacterium]|nr:hypothetical protein [Clostridia bacterium]